MSSGGAAGAGRGAARVSRLDRRDVSFTLFLVQVIRILPPLLPLALVLAAPAGPSLRAQESETHARLQAVTAQGLSAWEGALPFTLRGVLLNDPEEFLDATPQFVPWNDGAGAGQMGGQWQVFLQAADPGDRGGTACWMGQNYGNLPWIRTSAKSYSNAEWLAEIQRLSRDPLTHHRFRKGDLVEVTARRSLFYGGKRNINEAHDNSPEADFTLRLVWADHGLPAPEPITLADLVRPDDGDPATREDLFDPTRQTGGERYQGVRVRLQRIKLTETAGWGQVNWNARLCRVTDGAGRFLPVRTALRTWGPPPTGWFDAIGILNQESGSGTDGTFGYELFVQEIEVDEPPRLEISVITWPAGAGAFQLEFAHELPAARWQAWPGAPQLQEGRWTVNALIEPAVQRYFRLRQVR